jgi:glycosyltransferase A (GT-A) superfamily protein (DUF2064 family)
MVKATMAGAAQTRLAAVIGSAEALRFYRSSTAALLRRVGSDPRWRTILAVSPDCYAGSRFWPAYLPRIAQGPGDLGDRMQRLLEQPRGPGYLIGSDIPGIQAGHIAEAFGVLSRAGLVFGPSEDGGFWLAGARRPTKGLFRNVRWSTPHTLADTLANLQRPAGLAATLADVDTEADWRRWRRGEFRLRQREGWN